MQMLFIFDPSKLSFKRLYSGSKMNMCFIFDPLYKMEMFIVTHCFSFSTHCEDVFQPTSGLLKKLERKLPLTGALTISEFL